jgi:hypothetical protein
MIKNRELALIPDSALQLVEPPATAPDPAPRPSTRHAPAASHGSSRHRPRRFRRTTR